MPRLSSRNAMMINQRDHRNAGEHSDDPAHGGPQAEDIRREFVSYVIHDPALNQIAGDDQKRGKSHGHAGQYYHKKSDHAFFHNAPDFGHLISLAKALHPGNHRTGCRPQRQQAGRDEELRLYWFGAGDVLRNRGTGFRRQNPAQRTEDFADEEFTAMGNGQNRCQNQNDWEECQDRGEGRRRGYSKSVVLKGAPESNPQMSKEPGHTSRDLRTAHKPTYTQYRIGACRPASQAKVR